MELLIFSTIHFTLCLLLFLVVQKPVFYLYNKSRNKETATRKDFADFYRHGVRTDMIGAAYFTAIPVLVMWAMMYTSCNPTTTLLYIDMVIALLAGLLIVADAALYSFWEFKIDSSVFVYLRSLEGAFASVSKGYIAVALLAVTVMGGVSFAFLYPATLLLQAVEMSPLPWGWQTVVGLVAAAGLFAAIRGMHHRPNNPTLAFYTKHQFYNHCALNPLYSIVYSLSVRENFAKQFQVFDKEQCQRDFEPLFPTSGTPQVELFNTKRPNVLFIIWESLSARYISTLGGESGVMPRFEEIAEEGVLFTHCDCGSFRTDRGLVCLLSGYLGQPTTSVIRYTKKLPNLPALPRRFRDIGYETMAVHGGNCFIMHKNDYYLTMGHNTLVAQQDLPKDAPTCAWGIPDGYMFDWLLDDIKKKDPNGGNWFTTFQTLSSHQPFDVPDFKRLADPGKNSFAYVDDCFGRFIDQLKTLPAWDNLLVVVTGDHGFHYNAPISRDKFPHIPVLFLGGAVKQPMKIDTLMAQTDIAATLLGQLGMKHDEFIFSRDILADTYTYPFSLHTFNNGFLFRDATGYTHYDNVSQKAVEYPDEEREHKAKVILQTLYSDLAKR